MPAAAESRPVRGQNDPEEIPAGAATPPDEEEDGKQQVDKDSQFHAAGDGSASEWSNRSGDFDCNICLELARDPVVTLCGHLFCWPCLYRWINVHSLGQDCPVCKSWVEEHHVIPLYGRGRVVAKDENLKGFLEIPRRPQGRRMRVRHRIEHYEHREFIGSRRAIVPTRARFGHIMLSAGIGLFPALFGLHLHEFPDTADTLSEDPGFHLGFPNTLSHVHLPLPFNLVAALPAIGYHHEIIVSRLFLFLGCFAIIVILLF
ncbi:hypothetical protein O6H91_06G008100 [Diphasiastrum complanatum]|uniref:Uncharacterized protein n=1 Tax=Diphasiastrum complanatum TaxID=34168 RepID=A0ACC2DAG4_DIPCM|nr:hypothetical protein O6H91_06G008100 [Diphasiastrum complanatum]